MRRIGIILLVIIGLVAIGFGVLYWTFGDFAKGVAEDAKNHPMHTGNDTVALAGLSGMTTVHRPDGTTWKDDKDARGFLQTGWTRFEFDTTGALKREVEFASIGSDTYKLRETEYVKGIPTLVMEKPWFTWIYLKGLFLFVLALIGTFVPRLFINSAIYNRETGTGMSPIYAFAGPFRTKNFGHSVSSTYTFWWNTRKLKPENIRAANISNMLSVMGLVLFFGALIGLVLSGELH